MDGEFARRRSDVAYECISIDEFGIYTIRSVALAQRTEGRVGDILHRSEIKGVIYHFSRNHVIT